MSEHRWREIVIERPRHGMRISLKKQKGYRKQLDKLTQEASEDGLLSQYLIKPRNKSKYLSDHLSPLRRFLRSYVGQHWNTVYSKLCRRLERKTLAGQHVISHLWDYVERHVELIEGIPYRIPEWGTFSPLTSNYYEQFYVHPETGILCLAPRKPRQPKQTRQQADVVVIDDFHQYRKVKEIWYLITFEAFPPLPTELVRDVSHGLVSRQRAEMIKGQKVYAVGKRQCNKKEIKQIMKQLAQR